MVAPQLPSLLKAAGRKRDGPTAITVVEPGKARYEIPARLAISRVEEPGLHRVRLM
nr:hypothetical protein [Rhizobium rhizogenes]